MVDISNIVNSKQSLILLVMYKHVYNANTSMYPWKGARIVFTSGDMIKEDGRAGGGMGATL